MWWMTMTIKYPIVCSYFRWNKTRWIGNDIHPKISALARTGRNLSYANRFFETILHELWRSNYSLYRIIKFYMNILAFESCRLIAWTIIVTDCKRVVCADWFSFEKRSYRFGVVSFLRSITFASTEWEITEKPTRIHTNDADVAAQCVSAKINTKPTGNK